MTTSIVTDLEEFRALRADWERLHERARVSSVFTSWDWLNAWWRQYGTGQALRLLVARKRGEVVGLLPVYVQTVRIERVIPVRTLRFVGIGGDTSPDDLDALLDPDCESDTARALAAAVLEQLDDWDVLNLTDMAEDSEFRQALMDGLGAARGRDFSSARISYLTLPDSWEAYLGTRSHHRRASLRQARRKFEAQPGARFFVWDDPARLDLAIDRLVRLHHMRWQGRTEHYGFASPAYVTLHREVMHAFHARGWLRLYCLEVRGEIIAILYCFKFRGKVFHFQGGFDPAYANLGPGGVLMGLAVEHAIGEGIRSFDLLRGEHEYKTLWATGQRETYGCQVYRARPASLAYWLRLDWLPVLRQRLAGTAHRTA